MIEFKENFRTRLVKSNRPNQYTSLCLFQFFFLTSVVSHVPTRDASIPEFWPWLVVASEVITLYNYLLFCKSFVKN